MTATAPTVAAWEIRYCQACERPALAYVTHRAGQDDYAGLCPACNRDYAELCPCCQDGTAYPELDRPYCPPCADYNADVAREAYIAYRAKIAARY
jgi:hypothetical protein